MNLFYFEYLIIFSLIVSNIVESEAKYILKSRLCADIQCKEPIGSGKTNILYVKKDDSFVSFKPDIDVQIFGKTEDEKYLDIEVNGKRGFAFASHITEIRKIKSKTDLIPVEISFNANNVESEAKVQNESSDNNQIEDTVQQTDENNVLNSTLSTEQPILYSSMNEKSADTHTVTPNRATFTVIDGTTFSDGDIDFEPSATDSSAPATATKTPTVSINLNETDVKDSEVSADIKDNRISDSSENNSNYIISPEKTSPVVLESKLEPVEEQKRSVPEEKTEETKDSNESNDKPNENLENKSDLQNSDKLDSETSSPQIHSFNESVEPIVETSSESTPDDTSVPNEELKNNSTPESVDKTSDERQPDSNPSVSDTKTADSSVKSSDENKTTTEDDETSLEEEDNDSLSGDQTDNVEPKESVNNSADNSNEDKKEIKINETNVEKQNTTDSLEISPQIPDEIEKLPEQQIQTESPGYNQEMPIEPTVPPFAADDKVSQSIPIEENITKNIDSLNDKSNEAVDNLVVNDSNLETITNTSEESKDENKVEKTVESFDRSDEPIDDINNKIINDSSDSNDFRSDNDLNETLEAEPIAESLESIELKDLKVQLPEPVSNIEIPEDRVEPIEEIVELNKIQVPNVVPDVELPDPVIDSIKANIEPNIESQHIFKWMGLEGMGVTNVISDLIPDDIELMLEQLQISAQVVVFTFVIAFNWCLMKILLSVFNSSKKETELRNMCCKAERQIYYFEAEKKKLQTEIDRQTEKSKIAEERMQTAEHKVIPLEKEFNKLKNEREQLLQRVANLEIELESAAEAGLEANRLLNDFLTSQKENVNLNSSVDALQQQITKQSEIVAKYESTAHQKEKENRKLKEKYEKMSSELERMKNILKETENNLQIFHTNNEELKASKSELNKNLNQLEDQYSTLQIRFEEYSHKNEELLANVEKLSEELREIKDEIVFKDQKIESMNNILMKFTKSRKQDNNYNQELNDEDENEDETDQIGDIYSEKSLTDLVNIVEMEVQLKNLTNDKSQLVSKLEDLSEQCRQLSDKITVLEVDNQCLKTEKESAVQERVKAENKLEVLTDYYNKKELEFGKEIGVQHIQRRMKEEDAESMSSRLAATEEENVSLRSQLMSMKKEIEDTERKYKSQINQLEKQVHENWILARNAERKLDESKAEASVLRQTLTMSVKSPIDGFGGDASYMDDSASSISDHFGGAMPPMPPPPPPMPPPPPIFNPMMPMMHMPFPEDNDHQSGHWNQNMVPNMNAVPMSVPGMSQHFPPPGVAPMSAFNPIQNDMNANLSYGNTQAVNYVPPMQQMGQQWDPSLNRDTYTPTSHRSTSSPHSQYNMYSQSNSHYSNQNPIMTSMSSPLTNSMSGQFHSNPMTSVISPLVNSGPGSGSVNVLSEPVPSHWTQPQRQNGNISNLNYSHNQYNESEGSSRPTSRNDRNDNNLHTSIV